MVAVMGRIGPGVAATDGEADAAGVLVQIHLAQEHAAAFIGISFFAVAADLLKDIFWNFEHGEPDKSKSCLEC